MLKAFKWVQRFIDDIIMINAPSIPVGLVHQFLSQSQVVQGLHGIYPSSVALSETSQPGYLTAKYMDIHAYLASGHAGHIMTRLYDKRREPEFAGRLQPIRLQHFSTCLSASCRLNICDGQFVRMAGIVSDVRNFAMEIARLLTDLLRLGYWWDVLRICLWRRIDTTTILFGVAKGVSGSARSRSRGLFQVICDCVQAMNPPL